MGKSILSAVAISVITAFFCVGCGDGSKPSSLSGHWVYGSGATGGKPQNMELFKDGTGVVDGGTISWKVENKRLVILSSLSGLACNYKISGYELALTYDDGDSSVFVRKEKLEEFKTKRAAAAEAERLKQVAEKAKQYVEQAKQNRPQIEQLLEQYFVLVNGGTFTMGCVPEQGKDCGSDKKSTYSVTVSDFQIGKYEVTQKLWELVMSSNPSKFKGDDLPVEDVSWDDAQIFISVLNTVTGKKYRLPTEAEWEFAARGGVKSQGYKYSGSDNLSEVGWYSNNSARRTYTVGQKKHNELEIYDMSGNVWEWCNDWYDDYPTSAVTNPTGPNSGDYRVKRGGNWSNLAYRCLSVNRNFGNPSSGNYSYDYVGFRLAFDK